MCNLRCSSFALGRFGVVELALGALYLRYRGMSGSVENAAAN
jgi:hypothetical protein